MNDKKRLDVLVYERGLAKSREQAKSLIMSGIVYVDGKMIDKAGTFFTETKELKIELKGRKPEYVSRGGLKLEKAVKEFGLDFSGLICMDVGASTGGFTDCMLKNGAGKVYAVDVGYGLLDWKVRNDPRVIPLERTNARYLTPGDIKGERLDFVSVDVSFISLRLILPPVKKLLRETAHLVLLIKPQFEIGKGEVGKGGVIRDPVKHKKVIRDVLGACADLEFGILGITFSPIKGPKGNIEFLAYLSNKADEGINKEYIDNMIEITIDEAHRVFGR